MDIEQARERWREFQKVDPVAAAELAPFAREFGVEAFTYIRFKESPRQPRGRSRIRDLEWWVTNFPDDARELLGQLDAESNLYHEGLQWHEGASGFTPRFLPPGPGPRRD